MTIIASEIKNTGGEKLRIFKDFRVAPIILVIWTAKTSNSQIDTYDNTVVIIY